MYYRLFRVPLITSMDSNLDNADVINNANAMPGHSIGYAKLVHL